MKKIFILSLLLILCVGCTRIDNADNYDIIVDSVLNEKEAKPNTVSLGYKYYLPLGVNKQSDKDYNQVFKSEDNFIYLYVDVVSYYYHNLLNFNENNSASNYYYRKLDSNNKTGYIKITKEEKDNYYIKIVYNYAKIETTVTQSDIPEVLSNSLIIVNSINYNDILIKKILDDEYSSSVDKQYKIKKPKDAKSNFSEYLSEYVQDEENTIPDLPEY